MGQGTILTRMSVSKFYYDEKGEIELVLCYVSHEYKEREKGVKTGIMRFFSKLLIRDFSGGLTWIDI